MFTRVHILYVLQYRKMILYTFFSSLFAFQPDTFNPQVDFFLLYYGSLCVYTPSILHSILTFNLFRFPV